jgi:hypothetical protein
MRAIDKCPSGALSYDKSGEEKKSPAQIRIIEKGPIMVEGDCLLIDKEGKVIATKSPFALCRCGGSKNKPYCDGTHKILRFEDTNG